MKEAGCCFICYFLLTELPFHGDMDIGLFEIQNLKGSSKLWLRNVFPCLRVELGDRQDSAISPLDEHLGNGQCGDLVPTFKLEVNLLLNDPVHNTVESRDPDTGQM